MLTILSAIFAVINLVIFIPISLAFSAVISMWASYKESDLRLAQFNTAVHQMHQLVVWWDSLSLTEKRILSNKEFLVQTTEGAIQGQIVNAVAVGLGGDDHMHEHDEFHMH